MKVRPFIRRMELKREEVPDFNRYPFCIPAIGRLETLEFHEKVTFLTGENGTGKSTLMEAIAVACGFCPEGGGRNFRLETRATHSDLWRYLRTERGPLSPRDGYFLRAESFYNVASYLEDLDEGYPFASHILDIYGGSLHECSHGESFFALLQNRLGRDGLYLFDEPEAALSPMRQMAMLTRLHQLAEEGCQFIIATHSPILLAYPDSRIYQLDEDGVRVISYEECAPYRLTRRFLNDYRRMTDELLADPEDSGP